MIRARDLEDQFPWLRPGGDDVSGSDVIEQLGCLHIQLVAEETAGQPNRRQVEAALRYFNAIHGKGDVLEIVWGNEAMGTDMTNSGMVVRRMQYSMDAKPFAYSRTLTRKVNFLGRWRTIPQAALNG